MSDDDEIKEIAQWLVKRYLANAGKFDDEFVACITPGKGSVYHLM